MKAGLDLVWCNNFFYTGKGDLLFPQLWLIKRELELKETLKSNLAPRNASNAARFT